MKFPLGAICLLSTCLGAQELSCVINSQFPQLVETYKGHSRRCRVVAITKRVASANGVPDDRAPIVTVLEDESAPLLYNDPTLAARTKGLLIQALGEKNVFDQGPAMPSEDFGVFGMGRQIPTVMFWLNAMDPIKLKAAEEEGKELPGPHNSRFEPRPEPTLKTGVLAMTSVAIGLLQN